MTRKIFSSILSVSVIVLLLCLISISGILYGYFGNVIKKELRTEADIMVQQIEDDDTYLQNMNAIDNRVTLVDADGKVLFDSQADPADMENHNGRQEIKEARADGDSTVTRYSDAVYQDDLLCKGSAGWQSAEDRSAAKHGGAFVKRGSSSVHRDTCRYRDPGDDLVSCDREEDR